MIPGRPSAGPGWAALAAGVLERAGPGFLQFAVTSRCNARCGFCNYALDRAGAARASVSREAALKALDIAARNHIGYLLFAGGEPLLHPDLPEMVRRASELGMRPMICTNGQLWTDDLIRRLAQAGLRSVFMSVDAPDAARHEANRGLPGNCERLARANALFAKLGIQSTASVTASRLIADYDQLPGFLRGLGFASCTFSYPLETLASSCLSCADSALVRYTPQELHDVFGRILKLKQTGAIAVLNPAASLEDMQRHLHSQPERFACLAGFKFFYLDWNLDLYRCHQWEAPLCRVEDWDASKTVRDGCTRCMIDCYRDPSVLQYVAVSAHDAWGLLKRGRVAAAAARVFDRRNLTSLREVWANRRWVARLQAPNASTPAAPARCESRPGTPRPSGL